MEFEPVKRTEHKNKFAVILIVSFSILLLISISYAFYTYMRAGTNNNELIVGQIYLAFEDNVNAITLNNSFPESREKAFSRNDNIITFTIKGVNNTVDNDIYYEIKLVDGNSVNGKTRINPNDLKFSLSEIIDSGTENTVVYEASFANFNNAKLWSNNVSKNTTVETTRTYKLRMWISEDVFISDTNPKARYSSDEYQNLFASIKVSVNGDFNERGQTRAMDTMKKLGITPNTALDGCIMEGSNFDSVTDSTVDLVCPYSDDFGTTYYFRGIGSHNYVKYAGVYWRIVRINGDGTIRLIYQGETVDATENYTSINNTKYQYNAKYPDPTFVGYMYGKDFSQKTSPEITYNDINETTEYYFADDYEFLTDSEMYRLKGTTNKGTFTTNTAMRNTDNTLQYPYTCRSTSETGTCQFMVKVINYTGGTEAQAQYITYSSNSLEGTRTDNLESNAKTQIDLWYENKILNGLDASGKAFTSYLSDGIFCNDRSIKDSTYKSGFLTYQHTFYAGYTRIAISKLPSLKCRDTNDRFSTTTSYGNGKLKYPIALITTDEAALAGGKWGIGNSNYYLYTNAYFLTMTPSYFGGSIGYAFICHVGPSGSLGNYFVAFTFGLRPVINLRPDLLLSSGDGSKDTPYEFAIAD